MSNERKLSFDIIRIIAVAMVVMIHVSAYVVTYFDPDPANESFIVGNLFNCLGRAGTPMFLMLTGALLLDEKRKEEPFIFYKRKLLPLVGLLLFWLFFYATWRHVVIPLVQHTPLSLKDFTDYLLWLKGRSPHLWYLFMLIGAYLLIPVLRLFVKKENKNYILGHILLSVIVQFGTRTAGLLTLESRRTVQDFVDKFHMEYATGYVPYLLIGWYLTACKPAKKTRIALELTGLAALIAIILSVWFGIQKIPGIRDYVAEMDTLPAMLYGVGLFTFVCGRCGDRPSNNRIIRTLSARAFGVYILHVVVLELLIGLAIPYTVFGERNALLYILVLHALTFGISLLVTMVLSVIPGAKKLVRG